MAFSWLARLLSARLRPRPPRPQALGFILASCYLLVPVNLPPAHPRYYLPVLAACAALATASFMFTRVFGVCLLAWHHAPAAETVAQVAACALCGWMLLRREHGLRRALAAARAAGKLD